ncbi:MAG: endosialidase [Butyrivibrio sp.]|nr:endosialidase [Butyrivibrio sp.]
MAVVEQLLRAEPDGTISFGNYELKEKAKLENFKHEGNILKVKTFKDITKLEANELFVYESVPGTTVTNFREKENGVEFNVEGEEDAQITVGLEENTDYRVYVDYVDMGDMKTNLGGKLNISVELSGAGAVNVRIEK